MRRFSALVLSSFLVLSLCWALCSVQSVSLMDSVVKRTESCQEVSNCNFQLKQQSISLTELQVEELFSSNLDVPITTGSENLEFVVVAKIHQVFATRL